MRTPGLFGKRLPNQFEIIGRERHTKKILRAKFAQTKGLRDLQHHLQIGLDRLTEKSCMAQNLAKYMEDRRIETVEELAKKLFIGVDKFDAVSWMRYPAAFRSRHSLDDCQYLLALCDLQWNMRTRRYEPISDERP